MAASLETNKALAALLTAGIIASGSGVISRILYHPSMPEENAYVIAVPEAETERGRRRPGRGGAAAGAARRRRAPRRAPLRPRSALPATASRRAAPIKIGPPLWGVVGRDIASIEGFDYSEALRSKEGQWTFDNLYQFIHGPKAWAPGTKMAFAGIKGPRTGRSPGLSAHARRRARAAAGSNGRGGRRCAAAGTDRGCGRASRCSQAPAGQATEAGHQTAPGEQVAPAATAEARARGSGGGQQTAAGAGAACRRRAGRRGLRRGCSARPCRRGRGRRTPKMRRLS